MDLKALFTGQTLSMKSSMIRELVEMTKGVPDLISFAGGFPSPETFPKKEIAGLLYKAVTEDGDDIMQYGSSGGDNDLKAALIKYEGLDLKPDEIHICNGATNGIYYALKTLIEPGDIIISETPSFLGSLVAFEAIGAQILPISMDMEGIITDELAERIKEVKTRNGKIKFIYTIPDFQNPTGITMSRSRREELIRIAIENNILILEDDPYSKLRFSGVGEESLSAIARKEFQNDQVVISVRSFSKLLGPGLRVAYTIANRDIIASMNSWSQKVNVTTDRVMQKVVTKFLENDLLPTQIEKIISVYKPLRDQMISSLKQYMSDDLTWTEPEGGMFIWVDLPETENADILFKQALEKRVAYIPGSKFYPSGYERYNGLRLNFSYPTFDQIEEGVKRLASVCCR